MKNPRLAVTMVPMKNICCKTGAKKIVKCIRGCIVLFMALLCYVLPLQTIAAETTADSVLGEAWAVDQEMVRKESGASADQKDGVQILNMTGMAYYGRAYEAFAQMNQRRMEEGLNLLDLDGDLTRAAMQRAAECSVFYSHTRPNGLSCSSAGDGIEAENIAASTGTVFSTAGAVVDAWMNSAGHRQNMMNQEYSSVGIGCFYKDGVWYWAQEFGRKTAEPAGWKEDHSCTYNIEAVERYVDPFFVVEDYSMEKGEQIQYQIKLYNMGWDRASGYIDQNSYQWVSSSPHITVDQTGAVCAEGWGSGTVTAVNKGCTEYTLTGAVNVQTDAVIESVGEIYVQQSSREGLAAGLPVTLSKNTDVEYSWYVAEGDDWTCLFDWTENQEWFSWTPNQYGDYTIAAWARVSGNPASAAMKMVSFQYHPQIVGKCQMPYTGEGGGYLIGVESHENPGQKYQYEMLILDCTLLAEGSDAWIYSTGRCRVSEGKALWTVWQPQYGYYWTLFRVYDEFGRMIDEECYGFENI